MFIQGSEKGLCKGLGFKDSVAPFRPLYPVISSQCWLNLAKYKEHFAPPPLILPPFPQHDFNRQRLPLNSSIGARCLVVLVKQVFHGDLQLQARENNIQKKIWEVMLKKGRGTVIDINKFDPGTFEKKMKTHPKILIKW